jgi:hypothetical protein
MIKSSLLGFTSLCLIMLTTDAFAEDFLTSSQFLRENKARLVFAKISKSTVLIEAQKTPTSQSAYLLANDGNSYLLDGSLSKGKEAFKDECQKIPAANLRLKDNKISPSGMFVLLTSKMPKGVQWFPAKVIKQPKDAACASTKKGMVLDNFAISQSSAPEGSIFYYADLHVESDQCEKRVGEQIVGVWNEKTKKCTVINSRKLDCDGMQVNDKELAIQEFVGVLVLGTERWSVFNSSNYEATGFMAIPFDNGYTFDKRKIYVSRPYGC